MPRYRLKVIATATIEETWIAEGETPEDAFDAVLDGSDGIEYVGEEVLGDEENRELRTFDKEVDGLWVSEET